MAARQASLRVRHAVGDAWAGAAALTRPGHRSRRLSILNMRVILLPGRADPALGVIGVHGSRMRRGAAARIRQSCPIAGSSEGTVWVRITQLEPW
jgi:hypothetical protein